MANDIGDPILNPPPAIGTTGPGYAVAVNSAITEVQARLATKVSNGEMEDMPAGTLKANLGASAGPTTDASLALVASALAPSLLPALGLSSVPSMTLKGNNTLTAGALQNLTVTQVRDMLAITATVEWQFIDVKDIGVLTTNTGAQNTAALQAHLDANQAASHKYVFRSGTYLFDRAPLTGDPGRASVYLNESVTGNKSFEGQGMATVLSWGGAGSGGQWSMFHIAGAGTSVIEIKNLAIVCSGIVSQDSGKQHHHVNVAATAADGSNKVRRNVYITGCFLGATIGAGVRFLGEPLVGNYIKDCVVHNCTIDGRGIGLGSRSCIEIQRGTYDTTFSNVTAYGAKNSVFDSEITSGGAASGIRVHMCRFDGRYSQTTDVMSIGGASVPGEPRAIDFHLSECNIKGGLLKVLYGKRVRITNCDFEYDLGINPTVDVFFNDVAGSAGLISVRGENEDIAIVGCSLRRGAGFTNPASLVNVQALSGPLQRAGRILVDSCTMVDESLTLPSNVIFASDVNELQVRNTRVTSLATASASVQNTVIAWTCTLAAATESMVLDGIAITTAGAKYRQVITTSAATGTALGEQTLANIDASTVLDTANASSCIVEFTASGTGTQHENPVIHGCSGNGNYTWIASSAAAAKVFPVVAGNRGLRTSRRLEGTVTPNGNVLGSPGDMYTWRPTVQTQETWVKTAQTSSAVAIRDKNGWSLLSISGGGGSLSYAQNIGDGTTTAIVVTHSLGTRDLTWSVYDATTFEVVIPDVAMTTTNTATFTFAVAPTTNQYRVVLKG